MITIEYKGCWIHYTLQSRYYGLSEMTRVQFPDGRQLVVHSVHAAKCIITRYLKKEKADEPA